eukprot:185154-Hanusia_phi.AAC.10
MYVSCHKRSNSLRPPLSLLSLLLLLTAPMPLQSRPDRYVMSQYVTENQRFAGRRRFCPARETLTVNP